MNPKMIRDIVILAVIAVVAVVAYQFYSVGNRAKNEAAAPSTPPPPSIREGMPPAGDPHGGATMESMMASQGLDKVFNEEMDRIEAAAKIEKHDDYAKSGVVATVNGEKIPAEEFEHRLASRKSMMGAGAPHGEGPADDASAKAALLEKMIREALIRQEAARRGISVSEKEIQETLKKRMEGFPSEAEFNEVLKTHNFTVDDIRDQLAREMLVEKLKQAITKDAAVPGQGQGAPANPNGAEAE